MTTPQATTPPSTTSQAATLLFTPRRAGVTASGGTLDVLVRVQAPDLPQGSTFEGAPKRLALVVDRSGSMGGEPLAEALHCVAHIAQRLRKLPRQVDRLEVETAAVVILGLNTTGGTLPRESCGRHSL